eukprot:gene22589-30854_t
MEEKTSTTMSVKPAFLLKIVLYYLLLYFFTVTYNISNKIVLLHLPEPLPLSLCVVQLFLGLPLFIPIWILQPPAFLINRSAINVQAISLVAFSHTLGNVATMYSLSAGSVSFTHVVKSAEPIFTALLSLLIDRVTLSVEVYLSLIPIVVGVALASIKEASFSFFGFLTAMISNLFYQLRIVLSKKQMTEPVSSSSVSRISGPNLFRMVTLASFFMLLPVALLCEGITLARVIRQLCDSSGANNSLLLTHLLVSGVSYYMYNEVAFWILDLVHPITHAVGNTIKRVVLIVISLLVFGNPVTIIGAIGSSIAIMGSFLYVLAYERHSRKEIT